jgi:hypothetical protein
MTSKLSKKQLINDIKVFYLKQGKECEGICKISKSKLIELIIENDIPHVDDETLKNEIQETEKFNYYMNVIYYNFIKFNNISYDIISNIRSNSQIKSSDLHKIITDNNLEYGNDMEEIKQLSLDLFNVIHNYCSKTNTKNTIQFKTIPSIIQFLSKLNSH